MPLALYLEISFSLTENLTNFYELSLLYYLPIIKRRREGVHAFLKSINAKWKATNLVQDLKSGRQIHFRLKRR